MGQSGVQNECADKRLATLALRDSFKDFARAGGRRATFLSGENFPRAAKTSTAKTGKCKGEEF